MTVWNGKRQIYTFLFSLFDKQYLYRSNRWYKPGKCIHSNAKHPLWKVLVTLNKIPQMNCRWSTVHIFDHLCSRKVDSWGVGRSGTVKGNGYSVVGWRPWLGLICTVTAETGGGFLALVHTPCQCYGNEASQNRNGLIKGTTEHEFGIYSGRFFLNIDGEECSEGASQQGLWEQKARWL